MKGNMTVGTTCKSGRRPHCIQFSRYLTVLAFLAASMQITGCGGGGPSPQPTITGVTVSCSSSSILTNQTVSCSTVVTGTGSYSSAVTWAVSPAAMGTMNATGIFTPAQVGTATITATSTQDATKSGSASVTVASPITSVTVRCLPTSILFTQTSPCTATVTGTGSNGSDVKWSVSPTDIGSVSDSGVFTAASLTGTATITATSTQDTTKSGSAPIKVPGWIALEPMSGGYISSLVVSQGRTAYASMRVGVGRPAGTPGLRSGSLLKSLDRGTTWDLTDGDLPAPNSGPFVADPVSPDVLYAWTSLGLYKTSNGGTNWSRLGLNLPAGVNVQQIAIAPTNPNRIYVSTMGASAQCSTDGGNTWTKCSNGLGWLGSGPDNVTAMAVSPTNELVAYTATWRGLLFKTVDGGNDWQAIGDTSYIWFASQIYVAPSNPNVLYLLNDEYNDGRGTVLKSIDGGNTWTDAGRPDGYPSDAVQLQILPSDPNSVYATTSLGLYETTQGGGVWKLVFAPPPADGVPSVVSVALDPQDSVIYLGSEVSGVYRSLDGGLNWQQANQGVFSVQVMGLDVCSGAPDTIYAVALGQIPLKTVDSGTTWSKIGTAQLSGQVTLCLACSPADASHLLVSAEQSYGASFLNPVGNIWISNDGGVTLNPSSVSVQNPTAFVLAFNPHESSLVSASLPDWKGGFLYSFDGGSTWTQPNPIYMYPQDYTYHPVLENVVFTVTNQYSFDQPVDDVAVAYSVDSGATWNYQPAGQGWLSNVALDQRDPTVLYVAGLIQSENTSGVYKYKVTYNGNQISTLGRIPGTFNSGLTNPDIRQLLFNAATGYLYAATRSGIFRSGDGAATWTSVNQDLRYLDVSRIAISPDGAHLYAGTNGGIYEMDIP